MAAAGGSSGGPQVNLNVKRPPHLDICRVTLLSCVSLIRFGIPATGAKRLLSDRPVVVISPFGRAPFRFGPLHADDPTFILIVVPAIFSALEFLTRLWRRHLVA